MPLRHLCKPSSSLQAMLADAQHHPVLGRWAPQLFDCPNAIATSSSGVIQSFLTELLSTGNRPFDRCHGRFLDPFGEIWLLSWVTLRRSYYAGRTFFPNID